MLTLTWAVRIVPLMNATHYTDSKLTAQINAAPTDTLIAVALQRESATCGLTRKQLVAYIEIKLTGRDGEIDRLACLARLRANGFQA